MKKSITSLLFGSLILVGHTIAQKRPIDHSVYDNWENISKTSISPSGNLIYYTIHQQDGDSKLEVKTKTNQTVTIIDRASNVLLTDNEKYIYSLVRPFHEELKKEKNSKKKNKSKLRDSLYIYDINQDRNTVFSDVNSYKTALHNSDLIAFITENEENNLNSKDSTNNSKKDSAIKLLHILNVATQDSVQIPHVENYYWSPKEKYLVYTIQKKSADTTSQDLRGVYLFDKKNFSSKKISSHRDQFKSFTFDEQEDKLVYLADKSQEKSLLKDFQILYYTSSLDSAEVLISQNYTGIPEQWYIQGETPLSFSDNGQKLFLGLSPIPAVQDTNLIQSEHAKVDIWHWQDDYLQPYQLVNLKREQSRSFPAVYHFTDQSLIQLADDKISRMSFTDSGDHEWALSYSDFGNRISSQWEAFSRNKISIVSTHTGEQITIADSLNGNAYLSPNGKYVVLFDRDKGAWLSYEIATQKTYNLTGDIAISFANEDHDMPSIPNAYGIAAWSDDGKSLAIYDKYDIWVLALNGSKHQLATQGYGRQNRTMLRYLDLNTTKTLRRKSTVIDFGSDAYFTSFDEVSKQKGLYHSSSFEKKTPKTVFSGPFTYKSIAASNNQKHFVYTKEDYINSPDAHYFQDGEELRLSHTNPQQQDYNWGTAELVKWTTLHGDEAEGILYKPEDFDSNKKYPIIAYFYEILTDGLYSYQAPAPTPSRLNIPYFVSNGYLVFAPDIKYTDGYPGKSAEDYINSGMLHLSKEDWVDETKMGIQGQSWGGYQVAHLITRTNMYAAAWAGAPVVNMTSAYGGIRWQTGLSRQFQYERTQSRIGKNLWEALDLYIENSPLFYLDKVQTPVAIMHNDNDGAVPWYQGIEMFTALRRLQKPVWLLNYNGDAHNLMERQNRKDIQIREAQFFDHFLKGKPAAPWIEYGVPAIKKGIDWGF